MQSISFLYVFVRWVLVLSIIVLRINTFWYIYHLLFRFLYRRLLIPTNARPKIKAVIRRTMGGEDRCKAFIYEKESKWPLIAFQSVSFSTLISAGERCLLFFSNQHYFEKICKYGQPV